MDWLKKLLKRPYTMKFKCSKCEKKIILRSDIPLLEEKILCFKDSHLGYVLIETEE